jgi:hypothetical protein
LASDPTLQPVGKVTMISDKQKRQTFEADKLEVSRKIWLTIPVLLERVNLIDRHGLIKPLRRTRNDR